MRIAIHFDRYVHGQNWAPAWARACEERGISYEKVDAYSLDFYRRMEEFDILLWHFSQYERTDMIFARRILAAAKERGLRVFPDCQDSSHFDDKVAQHYLLSSFERLYPRTDVLYRMDDVEAWLDQDPSLPVVAKLRCGAGSQNVTLLKSKQAVRDYAIRMLKGRGLRASPSLFFKAVSNIQSSKSKQDFLARAKRIPDFIDTLRKARSLERERGYVLLQKMVPNDGFDIKLVVVNGKRSFIVRRARGNDFRASGGGDLFYDRSLVSDETLRITAHISREIGSMCMGYDVVVDNRTMRPYVIEMSFGFAHSAVYQAGGYWGRTGEWVSKPLDVPGEIIDALTS